MGGGIRTEEGAGETEGVREGTGEVEEEGGVEGTGEQGGTRGTGEEVDFRTIATPDTIVVTKGEGAAKEGAAKDTTISPSGGGG